MPLCAGSSSLRISTPALLFLRVGMVAMTVREGCLSQVKSAMAGRQKKRALVHETTRRFGQMDGGTKPRNKCTHNLTCQKDQSSLLLTSLSQYAQSYVSCAVLHPLTFQPSISVSLCRWMAIISSRSPLSRDVLPPRVHGPALLASHQHRLYQIYVFLVALGDAPVHGDRIHRIAELALLPSLLLA